MSIGFSRRSTEISGAADEGKRVEAPVSTGTRQPSQTITAGFSWIDASCKVCGTRHTFTRSLSGGEHGKFFQGYLSGGTTVTLMCANQECWQQAQVTLS